MLLVHSIFPSPALHQIDDHCRIRQLGDGQSDLIRSPWTGMGDDWDPFGDPADEAEPPPTTTSIKPTAAVDDVATDNIGELWEVFENQDKLAALRNPRPEVHRCTPEELAPLLDELFGIENDSDTKALQKAMEPVIQAVNSNKSLLGQVWLRGLPIMMDIALKTGRQRPELFGLLVDYHLGFLGKDLDNNDPSEVDFNIPPEADFSGIVVFILGWGGGGLADLADVDAFYKDLFPGALIVRSICNTPGSYGLRCQALAAIAAAAKAWATLQSSAKASKKLLVHMFSNAGMQTWTEILQIWKYLGSKDEVDPLVGDAVPPMEAVLRGIILDSAADAHITLPPVTQSLIQSCAAFLHSVQASQHDGSEASRKEVNLKAGRMLQHLIGTDSPVRTHLLKKPEKLVCQAGAFEAQVAHALEPPVQMQFIYSKNDTIILYDHVEDYIQDVIDRPSRKGFPVPHRHIFERSKHCFHKVNHKDEYWKTVTLFAKNVISE